MTSGVEQIVIQIVAGIVLLTVGAALGNLSKAAFSHQEPPPECGNTKLQQEHGETLAVLRSMLEQVLERVKTFEEEGFGRLRSVENKVAGISAVLKMRSTDDPPTDSYRVPTRGEHFR